MKKHRKSMSCTIIGTLLWSTVWIAPAHAQGGKEVLGVMDISPGAGISYSEAQTLTTKLISDLVNIGSYDVIEREKRNELLREQAFHLTGACDEATCLVQVGKMLGARKMVGGNVSNLGGSFSVTLRLVDVETGRIERSATRYFKNDGGMGFLQTAGMKTSLLLLMGNLNESNIVEIPYQGERQYCIVDLYQDDPHYSYYLYVDGQNIGLTPKTIINFPIDQIVHLSCQAFQGAGWLSPNKDYQKVVKEDASFSFTDAGERRSITFQIAEVQSENEKQMAKGCGAQVGDTFWGVVGCAGLIWLAVALFGGKKNSNNGNSGGP